MYRFKEIRMKSSKKVKKEPSSNVIDLPTTKVKKIDDLIEKLNKIKNQDDTFNVFWKDAGKFGDIIGIVQVQRFYEVIKGSIYFEYKDVIKDNCFKFMVIDISNQKNGFLSDKNYVKKCKMLEQRDIIYLKHHDINYILNEIEGIK
jgi:hypothetical protein